MIVAEALNSQTMQQITVTAERAKAESALYVQQQLIRQIEEQRMIVAEALNSQTMRHITVTAERVKADNALSTQSLLISQIEEQRAIIADALTSHTMRQITVTAERINKDKDLAKQSALVQGLEQRRVETEKVLTQGKKELAQETERLAEAEKEQAKQAEKAHEQEKALNKAGEASAAIIREINSKYGQYLGFMLSETASAEQLAKARELINAKLRETITLKQKEAALGRVEERYGEEANKRLSKVEENVRSLFGDNLDAAARVMRAITDAADKYADNSSAFLQTIQGAVRNELKSHRPNMDQASVKSYQQEISASASRYRDQLAKMADEERLINERFSSQMKTAREGTKVKTMEEMNATVREYNRILKMYNQAKGEAKQELAEQLYRQQRSYEDLFTKNADYFKGSKMLGQIQRNIQMMKQREKDLRKVADKALRAIDAETNDVLRQLGLDTSDHPTEPESNPWGSNQPADSTNYKDMKADALVARRKQMKEFVNAIQTDTNIAKVLEEDAALKKAIEGGMSKNMDTVIKWYNTERLKIEDELHRRYLTNTGDWATLKKEKEAKKRLTDETKPYLDEIDAYYKEREAKIKEAQNTGDITEAEGRRQTLQNELEWYQRRIELQKLYADRAGEVTREEQEAIFNIIADRQKDSAEMVEQLIGKTVEFAKAIGEKNANAYRKYVSSMDEGISNDLLRQQKSVAAYQKAISAILRKGFDSADKAYAQFKETLDALGLLLGNKGSLSSSLESFLMRTQMLAKYVSQAYKFSSGEDMGEQMLSFNEETLRRLREEELGWLDDKLALVREANGEEFTENQQRIMNEIDLRMAAIRTQEKAIEDFNAWIVAADKSTKDKLLVQLQEYNDNYGEAIRRIAESQAKDAERRFALSAEGKSYDTKNRWRAVIESATSVRTNLDSNPNSATQKGKRVYKQNRTGSTGTVSGTGAFGEWDAAQAEIESLDLQIERQRALMESTKELMLARQQAHEQELLQAQENLAKKEQELAQYQEGTVEYNKADAERKMAIEAVSQAQAALDAQTAAGKEVLEEQVNSLDELYVSRMQKVQ